MVHKIVVQGKNVESIVVVVQVLALSMVGILVATAVSQVLQRPQNVSIITTHGFVRILHLHLTLGNLIMQRLVVKN